MLNLQHALFCNDVSAHTHIYTHIILYKASIWILNVLFLITPLRIILLFTAPPKIIVHCAHYIESPYELCCILAHELLCVSRTFLKAPPQRMMLYFLLCLYTPLYSMHFVQTRHKNDCASHKNRPALLLCTLVPILFFAIYKQIKKVFLRQRPYRVECTGSLPNSEVKRRRARLVLGWGTAREDLRVLLAFAIGCALLNFGLVVIHSSAINHNWKIAGALPAGSWISVIMFPGRDDSTHNHFIVPLDLCCFPHSTMPSSVRPHQQ